MQKGQNQKDIKNFNRALILKSICTEQGLSRIKLSRVTGLTKMTVTNITAQLISEGLIREGLPSESQEGAGRKPILLIPCTDTVYAVGVYISRDQLKVSLLTITANILKTSAQPLSDSENTESFLQKVLNGIREITETIQDDKILGVGIACIGPLDVNNGVILSPPDFYGLHDIKIKEYLEENTGYSIVLNNDMKASALAEKLFGKGKQLDNFIYVGITHGIGSGIVMNGKLYNGEMCLSGEIGHTTINFNGPVCTCGNRGCLEVYASIPNLIKSAYQSASEKQETILSKMNTITFDDIVENAERDSLCDRIIKDMAAHLGIALANTINTLDLSTVIIGHEGAHAGAKLAGLLEEHINNRILFKNNKHINVAISHFIDKSPLIGSGVLVLDKFFKGLS